MVRVERRATRYERAIAEIAGNSLNLADCELHSDKSETGTHACARDANRDVRATAKDSGTLSRKGTDTRTPLPVSADVSSDFTPKTRLLGLSRQFVSVAP